MRRLRFDLGMKDDGTDKTESVECLGKSFESDEARRNHYLALLAEKLKDPEFRQTPGFPKGSDEAILRMSDPPYYTACPNPFLEDFVRTYGRPYSPREEYSRRPFAVDVKVGKTDPLYRAHGYHTKVPHLAIVPSILHYTNPGDVVLDGFSGSGMTGVAAQWCGSAPMEYRRRLEAEWSSNGHKPPEWGARRVILGDLGPAATFIAANYNLPFDVNQFATKVKRLLDEMEVAIGWMYKTLHTDGKTKGRINYTVWSEVLTCRECSKDLIFVKEAIDLRNRTIRKLISCPSCRATASKQQMDLKFESFLDISKATIERRPKRVPLIINYNVGKKRHEKHIDHEDLAILNRILRMSMPATFPVTELPDCQMTRVGRMKSTNTKAIHHMFLPRAAQAVTALWRKADSESDIRLRNILLFFVEQSIATLSVLNRYRPQQTSQSNQVLSGVYYVPSQIAEISPWYRYNRKRNTVPNAFRNYRTNYNNAWITTGSCTSILLQSNSIDYIFTDPPFGENIYYSDLNYLVESWHGVFTSTRPEAIIDRVRRKKLSDYQALIHRCFLEYFRVLKPGRWMTVVFSNSKNAIWRSIQESLGAAGFIVADVRTLDKKQGSFRQVTSSAVKQDLVISAYKPNMALTDRFRLGTGHLEDVWFFVGEHLANIPVFVGTVNGGAEVIAERTPQMLHDRMIAFFVQSGNRCTNKWPGILCGARPTIS